MKKIVALMLVLCMMLAAFPVFAESEGGAVPSGSGLGDLISGFLGGSESGEGTDSGLGGLISGFLGGSENSEGKEGSLKDLISGFLGGSESGEGKEGGLRSKLSGLAEKLKEEAKEAASALGAKLKEKVLKELSDPDSKLSSLVTKLAASLAKSDKMDVSSLLGLLAGGSKSTGDMAGETADEGETLEETIERLNKEAEAETGDSVPGKKAARSVEEFYGLWKETKFTLLGEDYDMSEYGEGAFIGENTYYVTLDGQKSPDYLFPETAELSIANGILKVNSDGHWSNFVLTEDGSMVQTSGSILIYYVRAE